MISRARNSTACCPKSFASVALEVLQVVTRTKRDEQVGVLPALSHVVIAVVVFQNGDEKCRIVATQTSGTKGVLDLVVVELEGDAFGLQTSHGAVQGGDRPRRCGRVRRLHQYGARSARVPVRPDDDLNLLSFERLFDARAHVEQDFSPVRELQRSETIFGTERMNQSNDALLHGALTEKKEDRDRRPASLVTRLGIRTTQPSVPCRLMYAPGGIDLPETAVTAQIPKEFQLAA